MWSLKSQRHETLKSAAAHGDQVPEMLAILGSVDDQLTVTNFARTNGWKVAVVGTLSEASPALNQSNTAVVLLDRDLPGSDWRSLVRDISRHHPAPCIILASSVLDDYLFDEMVKQGGFDIVAKPVRPDELRRIGGLAFTFWKSRGAATR